MPPIFIGLGFMGLTAAQELQQRGESSRVWPSSTAKIKSAVIRSDRGDEGKIWLTPVIDYEYEVDGLKYTGSRIGYHGFQSAKLEDVRSVVSRYPAGSNTKVYYDPKEPSECTLEVGSGSGVKAVFAVSILFVVVGTLFLLLILAKVV